MSAGDKVIGFILRWRSRDLTVKHYMTEQAVSSNVRAIAASRRVVAAHAARRHPPPPVRTEYEQAQRRLRS